MSNSYFFAFSHLLLAPCISAMLLSRWPKLSTVFHPLSNPIRSNSLWTLSGFFLRPEIQIRIVSHGCPGCEAKKVQKSTTLLEIFLVSPLRHFFNCVGGVWGVTDPNRKEISSPPVWIDVSFLFLHAYSGYQGTTPSFARKKIYFFEKNFHVRGDTRKSIRN